MIFKAFVELRFRCNFILVVQNCIKQQPMIDNKIEYLLIMPFVSSSTITMTHSMTRPILWSLLINGQAIE